MSDLREMLSDIVRHTGGLGFLETVKITGNEKETVIESMDLDKTVVLKAKLLTPYADFIGEFGMMNLDILGQYTSLTSFKTDAAEVDVMRRQKKVVVNPAEYDDDGNVVSEEEFTTEEVPEKVVFKSEDGSKAIYRFMAKDLVPKQHEFKGVPKWDFDFEPSKSKIQEFSQFAAILSKYDSWFSLGFDDGKLKFNIGDENGGSNALSVVFEEGFDKDKTVKDNFCWPCGQTLQIMKLGVGDVDMSVKIFTEGIMAIEMTSEYASWTYYLPAKQR